MCERFFCFSVLSILCVIVISKRMCSYGRCWCHCFIFSRTSSSTHFIQTKFFGIDFPFPSVKKLQCYHGRVESNVIENLLCFGNFADYPKKRHGAMLQPTESEMTFFWGFQIFNWTKIPNFIWTKYIVCLIIFIIVSKLTVKNWLQLNFESYWVTLSKLKNI